MKLQYLDEIGSSGNYSQAETDELVRLYDFNRLEATNFRDGIQHMVIDSQKPLALARFDFIESINCRLTLRLADEDLGITTDDHLDFYCDLTTKGYQQMVKLLAPFCDKESKGFQWLYDLDNPIEFLFAPQGTW